MLTLPRILGYAFNPLSVYFCHARDGRLSAILYEVSNTFGGRHSYLMPVGAAAGRVRQTVDKAFHVSPFMAMDLTYRFEVAPPQGTEKETARVSITVDDSEGPMLLTGFSGIRSEMTDANLRRVAIFRQIGGKRQAAAFDLASIRRGEMEDPPVYAGDIVIVDGSSIKALQKTLMNALPLANIFKPF